MYTPELENVISDLSRLDSDYTIGDTADSARSVAPLAIDAASEIAKTLLAKKQEMPAAKKDEPKKDIQLPKSEEPSFLKKMVGPLPVYGWGLVGVGALGVGYGLLKLLKKR